MTVVVVPTYEEAGNIAALLGQIRSAVPSAHVLVVDDDSSDGTADIAEHAGHRLGGVEVMRRPTKEGLGLAYRAGFGRALELGADVVATIDADLSHDPSALPLLVDAVEAGADLALGSRYVPGGSVVNWPASRRMLSRWGNRYATAALNLPVSDATSGYRAYRAPVVREMGLGQVRASGYGFLIEMVYRVASAGGKVVEVPITFVDRRWGASKMSTSSMAETAALVTLWGARDGVRDRLDRRRAAG